MSRLLKFTAVAALVALAAASGATAAIAAPTRAQPAQLHETVTVAAVQPAYWAYRHHHRYWVRPRSRHHS